MKKISKIVIWIKFLFIIVGCNVHVPSNMDIDSDTISPKQTAGEVVETKVNISTVDTKEQRIVTTITTPVPADVNMTPSLVASPPAPTPSDLDVTSTPSSDETNLPGIIYFVKSGNPKPSSEIRAINPLTGEKKILVRLDHQGFRIIQSPDKQYVSWIGQQFNPYRRSLWIMGPDKQPKQLTPWSESLGRHQWASDSQRIFIWEYDPDGPLVDVYAVSIDTQAQIPIWFASHPFDTIAGFEIAPNEKYVAYVLREKPALIIEDKAGNVWHIQELERDSWMEWSSDSQWLAYTVTDKADKLDDLFIINPTGQEKRKLVSGKRWIGPLVWSPSNRYLAFVVESIYLCYINVQIETPKLSCLNKEVWVGHNPVWLSDDQWLLSTNRLSEGWDIYRILLSNQTFSNVSQDGDLASDLSLWVQPTQ